MKNKNPPNLFVRIFCFQTPEPTGEANCNCRTGHSPEQRSYSGPKENRQVYLSGFLFSKTYTAFSSYVSKIKLHLQDWTQSRATQLLWQRFSALLVKLKFRLVGARPPSTIYRHSLQNPSKFSIVGLCSDHQYFLTLSTSTGILTENSDLGIRFFSQSAEKNPRFLRNTQSRSG